MVIYGWGKDLKELAYAGIEKCARCKNWGHFSVCEHSSHASLYFIKVARWGHRCVLVCKTCSHGWEIDAGKREQLLRDTIRLPSEELCNLLWTRFDRAAALTFDQEKDRGLDAAVAAAWQALAATAENLKLT